MSAIITSVLAVGVADRAEALKELPIRLFTVNTTAEAIRFLQGQRIDVLVSRWGLTDILQRRFLETVRSAKPAIPTVVFVTPGDHKQEIAARSLGVSAVLNEDVGDGYFRGIICRLLGISPVTGCESER